MGSTVQYQDERIDVPEDETVAEFKERVGVPEDEIFTFFDGDGDPKALNDDETMDAVPDGAQVAFQPAGDEIFGR